MSGERHAGGLWCREVLTLLPDFLDGELDSDTSASIEAHLRNCDLCERFGGRYQKTISALRQALLKETTFDNSRAAGRLHRRLKAALDSSAAPP